MNPSSSREPTRSEGRPFGGAFAGKRVLVTGHTGFKGSWLCEWLLHLDAEVVGLALPPETKPALFDQLRLGERTQTVLGDIRNADGVQRLVAETRPDFVFHLAAQPLVRRSYREPILTWQSNVMGTLHVMEALRKLKNPCAAVMVTSDKCYENREWHYGYREGDSLGGFDPYSSSKAAAELAVAAWKRSFLNNHPVRVASARAGNVIGGGDWSEDRIIPDCARAWLSNRPVKVRNPNATRPWQHVLEPLSGYLALAAALAAPHASAELMGPFNFGPSHDGNRSVRQLIEEALRHVPAEWEDASDPNAPHEAHLLQLSTDKAATLLHWRPAWTFQEAVQETVKWYFDVGHSNDPDAAGRRMRDQIQTYTASALSLGVRWALPTEPDSTRKTDRSPE
ncbi:MAG: CDP-glucose 4,6-dehydratase [Limisphaerales bacterium]